MFCKPTFVFTLLAFFSFYLLSASAAPLPSTVGAPSRLMGRAVHFQRAPTPVVLARRSEGIVDRAARFQRRASVSLAARDVEPATEAVTVDRAARFQRAPGLKRDVTVVADEAPVSRAERFQRATSAVVRRAEESVSRVARFERANVPRDEPQTTHARYSEILRLLEARSLNLD
ncbi:hypothetical protein CC2G_006271 [Coprinopsis cinerea AmutBmut pab1-1]|nr:hypothetical protein CC2G_006271 [Coprinopsis cinerea AmutBmut pab1-1]